MDLGLDPDELASCVGCGLCLPHCPTYRVTGCDTDSPRGRIALMHEVHVRHVEVSDDVLRSIETCVQCRGCETACPSGVPFGHLMEDTRAALARAGRITPWWQRLAMSSLGRPRLLRAGSLLLAVAQRMRLVPSRRLGLPSRLPIRRRRLVASGSDVHLFTGCVMDAWQRDTHLAVQRVVEAAGVGVSPTGRQAPCCGALHVHAGLDRQARDLAARVVDDLDDGLPVVVDSAGCGAALKDYGRLLGTPKAVSLSARVFDVHEWLAPRLSALPAVEALPLRVVVQDPCHLRHVQRSHEAVRSVLAPFVAEIVELDDDGLCCGAGGAYSLLEPELAAQIRQRKVEAIEKAGADVVASANPGCSIHLAAAGLEVRHPIELVASALSGSRS